MPGCSCGDDASWCLCRSLLSMTIWPRETVSGSAKCTDSWEWKSGLFNRISIQLRDSKHMQLTWHMLPIVSLDSVCHLSISSLLRLIAFCYLFIYFPLKVKHLMLISCLWNGFAISLSNVYWKWKIEWWFLLSLTKLCPWDSSYTASLLYRNQQVLAIYWLAQKDFLPGTLKFVKKCRFLFIKLMFKRRLWDTSSAVCLTSIENIAWA